MRVVTVIILIAIAIMCVFTFSTINSQSPDFLKLPYSVGGVAVSDALIHNELYDEAIICTDSVLKVCPDNAEALDRKVTTLMHKKQYNEAVSCFDHFISDNPDILDVPMLYKKAAIHDLLGQDYEKSVCFEGILSKYESFLKEFPEDEEIQINRAITLLNLESYDEAMDCYDKLIEKNPENVKAWIGKGDVYLFKSSNDEKKLGEMYKQLKSGLNVDGTGISSSTNMESYKKAYECYNKAIELDPMVYPSVVARLMGKYQQTIEVYQDILD